MRSNQGQRSNQGRSSDHGMESKLGISADFGTGQIISSIGRVPIEILPGKRHITQVLTVSLSSAGFQMEPPDS